ncbi:peptidoglycan-binding protein [Caulobacter sp. X]|uniref:peptidoglycan-binding protein n=1 Tax=Caulobacter sp. X TaxID=2048901 RepID=UPI000C148975|nr:peptidoglycan-binding protein [Caulobacter sp. X]PIB96652.1 Localization factor PodJS [Caulobacter sp. X]
MTAASPWSVKGIDPKAREVAKDLARRSGMTLGEWLNRMIIEGDGQADHRPASEETPSRAHLEVVRDQPTRAEIAEQTDQVGRVAVALDRLTRRIEVAEGRNAAAISGIDHSVRDAIARLGRAEREQIAVAARFEGAVDELKTEQTRTAERIRRIEAEAAGPRSVEALRALEGALGKVAGHLYDGEARTREAIAALEARLDAQAAPPPQDPNELVEAVVARLGERLEAAETRTSEALRELGASFSALDERLGVVESANPAAGMQERLDSLAATLSEKMEAARLEMAERLRETADGRFDRMERKLGEMAAHVEAAEQRSAQAIERMGREVVSVADAFNRRVQAAENRSAAAIEQVGGEVARIAASVETRLNRNDSVQGQALEKLGAEIARITERLTERIGSAERRNALAIDDVGEQVARVTERLNQRHERSSQELLDRIRQSEERTLRMLEEARDKIDTRLHEAQRKPEPVSPPPAPEPVTEFTPPPAAPFEDDMVLGEASPFTDDDVFDAAPPADDDLDAFPLDEVEDNELGADDFAFADALDEEEERDDAPQAAAPQAAPAQPDRPLSTREIIEQARAAARAAAAADAKGVGAGHKAKAEKTGGSLFGGFGAFSAKKPKRRMGTTVASVAVAIGSAAVVGACVGGLLLLGDQNAGGNAPRTAQALAERKPAQASVAPTGSRAAIALTSAPAKPAQTEAAPVAPALSDEAKALFVESIRKIETGDRTGLEGLKRVANGGYPAAQFYLSKLLESGKGGVKRDMVEARRWSERAANGGDPRAMHNLALYYFKGEGGPRNSTTAAVWFRKAADTGLVDSQFNLAQLYESGLGVSQNAAEAYKWYVIAGRAGDATARSRANALRPQLTAEALQTADRSALAFRAQAPIQTAALTATAGPARGDLGVAQQALSRLGYYQGPRDGVASPALRMAIAAYQRDQGLPASGEVDGETLGRLAASAH